MMNLFVNQVFYIVDRVNNEIQFLPTLGYDEDEFVELHDKLKLFYEYDQEVTLNGRYGDASFISNSFKIKRIDYAIINNQSLMISPPSFSIVVDWI